MPRPNEVHEERVTEWPPRYRSHSVGQPTGRIVHLVASRHFAGVERYVCSVAAELARRGLEVVVLGGDPAAMGPDLAATGVEHRPAPNPLSGLARLLGQRRVHILHAHMTNA